MTDQTPVLIIGAGGHSGVVCDILNQLADVRIIGFTDPAYSPGLTKTTSMFSLPIVGDDSMILDLLREKPGLKVLIGLGADFIDLRAKLIENLFINENIPSLLATHPSATVSSSASLDPGTLVMAGAVINPFARIGIHSVVNTGATVDHDCVLGKNVFVQPGANLAGSVRVGDNSVIGIGASVREHVTIGSHAYVGGGAFVDKDVADHTIVVGVPARPHSHHRKGQ